MNDHERTEAIGWAIRALRYSAEVRRLRYKVFNDEMSVEAMAANILALPGSIHQGEADMGIARLQKIQEETRIQCR